MDYANRNRGDDGDGPGLMTRVRESASAQLASQKDRATDGLGSVAQAVRQTTQQLREQHHDTVAGYVDQAADQIERLSRRLKQKDVGELIGDAQRLARRQPALFIGSAFAIGLLGARFMKSSAPDSGDRYRRSPDYGGYGSQSGAYRSPGVSQGYGESSGMHTGVGSTASGTAAGRAHQSGAAPASAGPTSTVGSTPGEAGGRSGTRGSAGGRESRGGGKTPTERR